MKHSAENGQRAYTAGRDAGEATGSWVIDGNTTEQTARWWLRGFEDGDPEVLDNMPSPLSGEWAGESIKELSDRYEIDLEDQEIADLFEQGYIDGWSDTVQTAARNIVG